MSNPPTPAFDALPSPLQEAPRRAWATLLERAEEGGSSIAAKPALFTQLPKVWACSEFVAQHCSRDPLLLADLVDSGDLERAYEEGEYAKRVARALAEVEDEEGLGRNLRRLRRREMVRIAWRDIAGTAGLEQTLAELSALADACIDLALEHLYQWQCTLAGTPSDGAGNPQRMVVIGMGKLGGGELNFSSDVDLIFAYPEEGVTRGGRRELANAQFFLRLAQQLIRALDTQTAEGFVFRVDMRLRPFGESGSLVVTFDAMENYYQTHGRDWERYAMIKARIVAGDREQGAYLLRLLRPFVYRRYLDFGVFESLREMKAMIREEVQRKGLQDNIKLGPGGIREIEFTAQAFQIIRGGRDRDLQARHLLTVLRALGEKGLLPDYVVNELGVAYIFLRNLEHRLQEVADRQTQVLPTQGEERLRIALGMGYGDWESLETALGHHRQRVAGTFEQVFSAPQTEAHGDTAHADLAVVWRDPVDSEQTRAILANAGFRQPDKALALLRHIQASRKVRTLSAEGRARLDQLMPLLLGAASGNQPADATLERLARVVEAVGGRTVYLALLVENPMALSQLARLCAASPWIADQVARQPLLLDDLIDPRTLYAPPDRKGLEQALKHSMQFLGEDDLEARMEALRRFQQTNQLRVAAADVVGALPLMEVSDHLTDLAEVVLQEVIDMAWRTLVSRYGSPPCDLHGTPCDTGFAVIGYGKMGGLELGYGSDLDIVFVHAGRDGQSTDGERPIDCNVFYARLAQRMIHIITTHTPAGRLYETDLRLRPSGASGLMVTSLDALASYQRQKAWTWEHQALVRARPVAGDPVVGAAFEAIRREILALQRDPEQLRREVREMREKMRTSLGSHDPALFDLKQDPGGIADIEFIVQYAVLRWAKDHPALLRWTDNIRLLDTLAEEGLMPDDTAEGLAEAYRTLRAEGHRLTLAGSPARVDGDSFGVERERVLTVWKDWLEH